VGLAAMWLTAALLGGCSNEDHATAEANLQKWQAKGPKSYVYVLDKGCLCANTGPTRVVVTDDVVTSAINTDSGDMVAAKTMTELLQSVVTAAGENNDSFEADYDPTLGYLKRLEVDHTSASDDEFGETVTCLAEGTSDDICPAP
jgi:Family of unknown function (DUF6174)